MTCGPIFITLLCGVPIFITDVCMYTYIYNKNVPIIIIQSPYFYNGFSGSVPIFINSRFYGVAFVSWNFASNSATSSNRTAWLTVTTARPQLL
jgi:hypothetical protein